VAAASRLIIIGLGPGDASLLTVEARDALAAAPEVWLRTARHPTVGGLPQGPRYQSFDEVYERGASFAEVYGEIVERVLELAARPAGVVYAVPGHPLFGEATVRALLERAPPAGIGVRIVPGISFLDAVAAALGLDPLAEGLLLLDALSLGEPHGMLAPQRPTVIAQVYDQRAASQAKLALLDLYPPEHPVRVVSGAGTTGEHVTDVALEALDRSAAVFDHLTSVYVRALPAVADTRSFAGLRYVVARLRAPEGGCPWDLEQTHETLKRYLLEEAYEAIDALDEREPHRIAEELGDLMMQVLLHAQVAEDAGEFTIEDVIGSINAKLIRRHPHVFGDVRVEGAGEVLRNWEILKKEERGDQPLLDAVPKAMPALAQAQSVQGRAAKAGLGPEAKPASDLAESIARLASGNADAGVLGGLLFAIVELARERDLDAEESLRMAVRRFRVQVAAGEGKSGT
jgi:tetrapyrrole methylase family protein/MazG family protein